MNISQILDRHNVDKCAFDFTADFGYTILTQYEVKYH